MNTITQPEQATQQKLQRGRFSAWLRSPLCYCLLLALALRLFLIIQTNGVLDGDEALIGIQAQHILRGEWPVYFYGQPYLGSLGAYFMAILFAIAGSSVWTLRAEPLLLSLLLVYLTWKLAAMLADFAQLQPSSQRLFILLATLCAAVTPLYDAIIQLRALDGYIETFVLMLLLLIAALSLTRRWRAGATSKTILLHWLSIGFIVGLGLWINPLLASAMLAIALWIAAFCCIEHWHARKMSHPLEQRPSVSIGHGLLLAIAGIPACILGMLPAILWGASHNWLNATYILNLSQSNIPADVLAHYPTRLALSQALFKLYTSCVAPRIIGGAMPFEQTTRVTILHAFTLALALSCIALPTVVVGLSLFIRRSIFGQVRRLVGLPLLFSACTALLFCSTTTAAVAGLTTDCSRDLVGRYATPLLLALPFFVATTFTLLIVLIKERHVPHRDDIIPTNGPPRTVAQIDLRQKQQPQQPGYSANWLSRRASRTPIAGTTMPGPPIVVTQALLIALLTMYLSAHVYTYLKVDAGQTFQSPYCIEAPSNNDAIIAYLQQEHIQYAWAINFLAYPVVFKTRGSIIMTDPSPIIHNYASLNRLPAFVDIVRHADRPSFMILVGRGIRNSPLVSYMDTHHISYRAAYFPAQMDSEILVVTPLNKTVSPFAATFPNYLFRCGR